MANIWRMCSIVYLLCVSEVAASSWSPHRPDEVHAPLAVLPEEGVVGGDLNGEAARVPERGVDEALAISATFNATGVA